MIIRLFFFYLSFFSYSTFANTDKVFTIYHDADYSSNLSSAQSMKMGLLTAFDEVNNEIQGYRFTFQQKNHRGNIKRSLLTMQKFINDDRALFIIGGLHSPPYIKNRAFINENSIPLFIPWAAGGPITRYPSEKNWVFRLSIDDTKAGVRISEYALNQLSCRNPHLLLENTPWGKSNEKTMSNYLTGKVSFDLTWFGWNTKQNVSRIMLREILSNGHDCLFLVANYGESAQFVNAMMSMEEEIRIPILSHWGVTGGDVDTIFTEEVRQAISFNFIQSCYAISSLNDSAKGLAIKQRAKKLFPNDFDSLDKIKAPAGFIHAYDLGKVIIAALQQVALTGDVKKDRLLLRDALENLKQPVQGLIKKYNRPFSVWHKNNPDAHEALRLENFCMAEFGHDNQINVKTN